MSRTKRAVYGSATTALQYALQVLMQFALAPMVLQHAGPSAWGAFTVIMQAISYLGFLDLGFNLALERYLANACGLDDQRRRFNLLMSTGRTFLLGVNVTWAVLVAIVAWKIDWILGLDAKVAVDTVVVNDARLGLLMLAAWGALRTPLVLAGTALVALQNMAAYNLICTAANLIRLAGSLFLVWRGWGLVGLMSGNIIAEVFEKLFCFLLLRSRFPEIELRWGITDNLLFKEMLNFGSHAMVVSVGMRMMFYSDNLVVGRVISLAAASTYYSTLMPAQQAWSAISRVVYNSLPAINELYGQSAFARLREVFIRIHRYNLLMVLPLAAGIVLLNHDVIRVWLKDHAEAQYGGEWMSVSLALIAVAITTGAVSYVFVMATGRIREVSYVYLVVGGLKVVVSVGMAYWVGHGIASAVSARLGAVTMTTAVATAIMFFYINGRAQREMGLGWGKFMKESVAPAVAATVLGLPVLWILREQWHPDNLVTLGGVIGVYLLAQGGISFWALRSEDRHLVLQQAGAVLGWGRKTA